MSKQRLPKGNNPLELRRAFQQRDASVGILSYVTIDAIAAGDWIPVWDTSEGENRKVAFSVFEAALTHDNLVAGTIDSHDTTATGAQLTTLTDDSMADALHRHSELSASDGDPDATVQVNEDGNVGIGKVATNDKLSVAYSVDDISSAHCVECVFAPNTTATAANTNHAMAFTVVAGVASGITNSGRISGINILVSGRNTTPELFGTLEKLVGMDFSYGMQTGTGTIEKVIGLNLRPRHQTGVITVSYDLKIDAPLSGGSVTTDWAIHCSHNANSYLAGQLGLGATPVARLAVRTKTTEGKQAVTINQLDTDKSFIDYVGTSAASAANNISTWVYGNSIQGFTLQEVNGAQVWMPHYDAPTGPAPASPITADSVTLNAGSATGGNVASTQTLWDSSTYDVDEVTATPGFDLEFAFSGVTTFNRIWLHILYNGSTTHNVQIRLYNYTNSNWNDVFLTFIGQAQFEFLEFPILNVSDYIDGSGNAALKIYHSSAGNASHDIQVEYVALAIV